MYRGPTNYKIHKMSKNCFYTKTQAGLKLVFIYLLQIKYNNEQLVNRNFFLGAVFGRLAIISVYKLFAQINFRKSFDGKFKLSKKFLRWQSACVTISSVIFFIILSNSWCNI